MALSLVNLVSLAVKGPASTKYLTLGPLEPFGVCSTGGYSAVWDGLQLLLQTPHCLLVKTDCVRACVRWNNSYSWPLRCAADNAGFGLVRRRKA